VSGWLRIEREPGGGFLAHGAVGADTVCFVEGTSGTVTWARRYPVHAADAVAAGEWAATAGAVAATAKHESATVVGEGALAALIRLVLPSGHADAPAGVVVETTGSAACLAAALRLVRHGGRVVLAARPLWATTPLRSYHDVHRPGISLVTVPWACDNARPPDELLTWALAHLAPAELRRPVRPAPWYRLVLSGPCGRGEMSV